MMNTDIAQLQHLISKQLCSSSSNPIDPTIASFKTKLSKNRGPNDGWNINNNYYKNELNAVNELRIESSDIKLERKNKIQSATVANTEENAKIQEPQRLESIHRMYSDDDSFETAIGEDILNEYVNTIESKSIKDNDSETLKFISMERFVKKQKQKQQQKKTHKKLKDKLIKSFNRTKINGMVIYPESRIVKPKSPTTINNDLDSDSWDDNTIQSNASSLASQRSISLSNVKNKGRSTIITHNSPNSISASISMNSFLSPSNSATEDNSNDKIEILAPWEEKQYRLKKRDTFVSRARTPEFVEKRVNELDIDELFKSSKKKLNDLSDSIDDIQTISSQTTFQTLSNTSAASRASALTSVDSIVSDFSKEQNNYNSIITYVQVRLQELWAREGNEGKEPNMVKAAIVADLMHTVSVSLSNYSSILLPLVNELCNCIYIDYYKFREKSSHRRRTIADYYNSKTYFEQYHFFKEKYFQLMQEQDASAKGLQLQHKVRMFNTVQMAFDFQLMFIRDSCFFAWKKYGQQSKVFKTKRLRANMQYFFRKWKQAQIMDRLGIEITPPNYSYTQEDLAFENVIGFVTEAIRYGYNIKLTKSRTNSNSNMDMDTTTSIGRSNNDEYDNI